LSPAAPLSPDDSLLIQAIATHDKDAFQQLYERHGSVLFSLALKILGDRSDAEDVLQDTFIQVWKTADSYDERRGKPLSWLIMLTRSRAIDRLRSRATRARATEAASFEPRNDPPLPAQQASASEMQIMVRRIIEALPPEQRAPIELAYFGGLTQTEIAHRLGQPLGTVKTRMRTAMLRLREQLSTVSTEGGAR
jgi:RNA polymerase sigma-70 factor (ECF subfamily)